MWKLSSLQKHCFEVCGGPFNGTCCYGKSYRLAFHSPAQPVEKLFFCSFDHHWITTNAENVANRVMRFQFF